MLQPELVLTEKLFVCRIPKTSYCMQTSNYDVVIVGAGIVGLATAKALVEKGVSSIAVVEAEDHVAAHQTGHNSGVIHSGLYYKPGSLKAQNCAIGRELMYQFCQEHDIPHERCGKVVVATRDDELPALEELERRGTANGLQNLTRLNADQVKEHEPHVQAIAGLFVRETGVVDYKVVARKFVEITTKGGGEVLPNSKVTAVKTGADGLELQTAAGPIHAKNLINCGGLHSDRVARLCGVNPGLKIVPFRGEYYEVLPERAHLVKHLIYPVPDPRFPFLGVHFTRAVDGMVDAGPNAVLALSRHGYSWGKISLRDLTELLTYGGFWKMAWKYAGMGMAEMYRSLNRQAFVREMQRLIPEIRNEDVRPCGAGVRAQALEKDGKLVDDFRIVPSEGMIHVLNAPSPAATSSISIGNTIADMAMSQFSLAKKSVLLAG